MGLVTVAAATPKFIFDYGANLYKAEPLVKVMGDHAWFYVSEDIPAFSVVNLQAGRLLTSKMNDIQRVAGLIGVVDKTYRRGDRGYAFIGSTDFEPSIKTVAVRVAI